MSSLSAVLPYLEQKFDSQRLVFWHDACGEYAAAIEALDLSGVTVICVENNEYAVKNRVLHDEPAGKFLGLATGCLILSLPMGSSPLTGLRS